MTLVEVLILNKVGTKKQVKKLIKHGKIVVDGQVVNVDQSIDQEEVYYEGKQLDNHPLKYYVINKPSGYVCANKDPYDPCLISLLPDQELHYVGRLDRDTTGLVIMTNDLKLRKKLTLPEYHIPRSYHFTCLKPLENTKPFKEGIIIDQNVRCLSSKVEMTDPYEGIITLTEGRYHEIKKMFLSLDNRITSLHRIMYGDIVLGHLKEGEYRSLEVEEINHLKYITRRSSCVQSKK